MKILFINNNSIGRGTYWRCYWLARYLVKAGHQVTMFCLQKRPPNRPVITWGLTLQTDEGVKIIALPRIDHAGIGKILAHFLRALIIVFYTFFVYRQVEVIHCFNVAYLTCGLPVFPFWLVKKLGLRKYLIVVDMDDWWGKGGLTSLNNQGRLTEIIADFLETKVPPLADKVTVVSDELRLRATRSGAKRKDVYKLINGSDVENVKPVDKHVARKKLGLPLRSQLVCFASSMVTSLPMVVESFQKIIKKAPEVRLVLLNLPSLLGDREKKLLTQGKFAKQIISVGYQPYEKYLLYLAASDVLLLPRLKHLLDRVEFPGRLGDFMASARPIITNQSGDPWKIIKKHEAGLVARVDSADLAQKILEVLGSPRLARKLSKNARRAALNYYSWEKLTAELVKNVYEKD